MKYKLWLHSYVTKPRQVYAKDLAQAKSLKKRFALQGYKVEVEKLSYV